MNRRYALSFAALAVLLFLGGCASVSKVESGDRAVGERLAVKLEGAWNQINAPGLGASEVWTMEGLPVDQLLFYAGLKDGDAVRIPRTAPGSPGKPFNFRATMLPDQIVGLFESALSEDGSTYKLTKLEPARFAGGSGFRFEYGLTRKVDSVQLSGVGYGVVHKGELFAIVYMAPRLIFFQRHAPSVERIARSALVRD